MLRGWNVRRGGGKFNIIDNRVELMARGGRGTIVPSIDNFLLNKYIVFNIYNFRF